MYDMANQIIEGRRCYFPKWQIGLVMLPGPVATFLCFWLLNIEGWREETKLREKMIGINDSIHAEPCSNSFFEKEEPSMVQCVFSRFS